jgi:hypothetical protein
MNEGAVFMAAPFFCLSFRRSVATEKSLSSAIPADLKVCTTSFFILFVIPAPPLVIPAKAGIQALWSSMRAAVMFQKRCGTEFQNVVAFRNQFDMDSTGRDH